MLILGGFKPQFSGIHNGDFGGIFRCGRKKRGEKITKGEGRFERVVLEGGTDRGGGRVRGCVRKPAKRSTTRRRIFLIAAKQKRRNCHSFLISFFLFIRLPCSISSGFLESLSIFVFFLAFSLGYFLNSLLGAFHFHSLAFSDFSTWPLYNTSLEATIHRRCCPMLADIWRCLTRFQTIPVRQRDDASTMSQATRVQRYRVFEGSSAALVAAIGRILRRLAPRCGPVDLSTLEKFFPRVDSLRFFSHSRASIGTRYYLVADNKRNNNNKKTKAGKQNNTTKNNNQKTKKQKQKKKKEKKKEPENKQATNADRIRSEFFKLTRRFRWPLVFFPRSFCHRPVPSSVKDESGSNQGQPRSGLLP